MIDRRTLLVASTPVCAAPAMAATGPDWETASPQSLGLHDDALAQAWQAAEAVPGLRAVAVAVQGRLVAERGFAGASPEQPRPINSATKSVCSQLVGLAVQQGRLALDDTVAQLLPEAAAEWPDAPLARVTLRQLLAGRTGQAFDWSRSGQLSTARSLARFVFGLPAAPVQPPGWSYNDAAVALLAPILQRAHGADLEQLAERQLFGPLGITRTEWRRDAEGQPTAPGGLVMRPRDLLKLAAVMLDGGRWRGQPVLPERWVAESLEPKGPATWRVGPMNDIGYGYLWFTGQLHGQRVAWAWGYGGQFALLAPQRGLAVATASTSPPPSALREQTDAVMGVVGRILQAAG